MILKNQKLLIKKPIIPLKLKDKISFFSNCDVTIAELKLFDQVLQCVATQLENEQIDLSSFYKLNVFFTSDGSMSFVENDDRNNGSQIYMAVYRMDKLRRIGSVTFTAFVFAEELAHYYWRIYDESIVKYKVVEILNHIFPNLTIEEVKGWGLNGL